MEGKNTTCSLVACKYLLCCSTEQASHATSRSMSLTIQHSFLEQSLETNLDTTACFKICGSELSIQRLRLLLSGVDKKENVGCSHLVLNIYVK